MPYFPVLCTCLEALSPKASRPRDRNRILQRLWTPGWLYRGKFGPVSLPVRLLGRGGRGGESAGFPALGFFRRVLLGQYLKRVSGGLKFSKDAALNLSPLGEAPLSDRNFSLRGGNPLF